jgi:hypothetical protein
MLKNYFKIAWRNISRHKIFTLINVLGLSLGACACIVIYLITSYEFSFDKFHPDQNRIFRIIGESQRLNGEKEFLNSPVAEVSAIEYSIPGFEAKAAVHFYDAKISITSDDKQVKNFDGRNEIIITESQYFEIFKYVWLAGDPKTALTEPFKVVLSQNKARKYFGDLTVDKIIGKTIVYNDSLQVTVSGIVKDWDQNSDFNYTDFISISTAPNSFLKNQIPTIDWKSLSPHRSMAFVKLASGVSSKEINNRFVAFIKKNVKIPPGGNLNIRLQPLGDIHFTKDFHRGDDGDGFRKAYLPTLYALMGLAVFILLIAAVNFINLSTAQSVKRAKEIGIRKVLGSNRKNVIFQFLTETTVITFLAVVIAIVSVKPILQALDAFIPPGINFHLFNINNLIFLLSLTLVTALLAGFYPAKVLSAYRPVITLKGPVLQKSSGNWNLRKGLIVFQFTLSLVFIIGAIVIGNQIKFMNNTDKGFKTNGIITINKWGDVSGKLQLFIEKISRLPGVEKAILQGNAPMGFAHTYNNFKYKGKTDIDLQVSVENGN